MNHLSSLSQSTALEALNEPFKSRALLLPFLSPPSSQHPPPLSLLPLPAPVPHSKHKQPNVRMLSQGHPALPLTRPRHQRQKPVSEGDCCSCGARLMKFPKQTLEPRFGRPRTPQYVRATRRRSHREHLCRGDREPCPSLQMRKKSRTSFARTRETMWCSRCGSRTMCTECAFHAYRHRIDNKNKQSNNHPHTHPHPAF